jgi:hypothetical protein
MRREKGQIQVHGSAADINNSEGLSTTLEMRLWIRMLLKPFCNPYRDQRLPGHTQTPSFLFQTLDHPDGKIDVNS